VFKGFDIVDYRSDIGILTNCGGKGFPFAQHELNEFGLLDDLNRAYVLRDRWRIEGADSGHAEGLVWAIWRMEKET
jgi:hypothetical protein